MFSRAVSSKIFCCRSFPFDCRSLNATARHMPRIIAATLAMTRESDAGETDGAPLTRAGSGMINTAPMPVKCMPTIANVRRKIAIRVFSQSSRRAAKNTDKAPNAIPNTTEATTRLGNQVMRPGTSSAIIPV